MKKLTLLFLIVLTLGATGCPRYETVRKLSSEQLRVQEGFQDTLKTYFANIEQFAANQIIVDKLYYDDLADQKKDLLKRRAKRDLATLAPDNTAARDARNVQLGSELQNVSTQNETDKQELDDTLAQLKSKHQEILNAYQAILDAQKQLDEYIQLKKADEVIVEQLLGKIKINQLKITNLFDQAANLATKIKVKDTEAKANLKGEN